MWHDVFFGLLNSAQHQQDPPPPPPRGSDREGHGRKETHHRQKEDGELGGKLRTRSLMRIGMDLGKDEPTEEIGGAKGRMDGGQVRDGGTFRVSRAGMKL